MAESLYYNILEHELLAPRTVEAWDHNPLYCYLCHLEEFIRLRTRCGIVLSDFLWPVGDSGRKRWEYESKKLRAQSVVEPSARR